MTADDLRFARVEVNGICLHVAQAGPADGPLVILLHGFPEFWYEWRNYFGPLADAGYCVWAPDQRGYNLSNKPRAVRAYRLDELTADVAGLISAAGRQRATIVGHDWGGAVAWWLAANTPERIEKLVILNVPHPLVMRRLLLTSPAQMLRSWYMLAFQLPWLPEIAARRNHWNDVVQAMKATSRPGTFGDADFDLYRAAWSQPGAYTAMLAWYRATFRYGAGRPRHDRIDPPTLILWGERDSFISPQAAAQSLALCERGRLKAYAHATHWLVHEEATEIRATLLDFLAG